MPVIDEEFLMKIEDAIGEGRNADIENRQIIALVHAYRDLSETEKGLLNRIEELEDVVSDIKYEMKHWQRQ